MGHVEEIRTKHREVGRIGQSSKNFTCFSEGSGDLYIFLIFRVKFQSFRASVAHSCQQKSIGLKFSKSQTGSDLRYSCHHNSSRFTFPIFAHSFRFSVLHSLQSITPRIYRVIRKFLRDFRPLRYSSRDGHAEGEHVNRKRDTPSFCPTLQVLDMLTSEGS